MSENRKINDLYRRVAGLERRIDKLENGVQELDRVVDPQSWIGAAFGRLEEDIDELKEEMSQIRQKVNGKLDAILQHLTGLSDS